MGVSRSYWLFLLACAAVLQAVLPAEVLSQGRALRFEHITRADGIPHDVVTAIHRDRIGFLWVGTEDGLARYDGQDWIRFRSDRDDSTMLSGSLITAMHQSDDNVLLVGTRHGGLNRIDLRSNSVERIRRETDGVAFNGDAVTHMAHGSDGSTIVAYGRDGLWRLDAASHTAVRIVIEDSLLADVALTQVAEDGRGRLWVGTWRSGVFVLEPVDRDGLHYRAANGLAPDIPDGRVRALVVEPDGRILVGTSGAGLIRWDPASRTAERWSLGDGLSDSKIFSIVRDPYGIVWIGTVEGGLNRLDPETGSVTTYRNTSENPGRLSHNTVNAVMVDSDERLWLGSDAGIDHARLVDDRFDVVDLAPEAFIMATGVCTAAGDCVLVATTDGFFRVSLGVVGSAVVSRMRGMTIPGSVSVLAMIGRRSLLVATRDDGLYSLNPEGPGEEPLQLSAIGPDVSVQDLAVDRQGRVWVGSDGAGVSVLRSDYGLVAHWSDSTGVPGVRNVSRVHAAGAGIWIGTFDGRVYLAPESTDPPIQIYPIRTEEKSGRVVGFADGADGSTWVAYRDRIVRFDTAPHAVDEVSRQDGLPSESIVAMAAGPDFSLWTATQQHLVGIRAGEVDIVLPLSFLVSQAETVSDLRGLSGGWMVLATDRRLYAFRPDELHRDGWAPSIVLTRVTSGTQVVATDVSSSTRRVTLRTAADAFSFTVAMPEFSSGDDTQLSYRLEGFDDGWQRTSGSHATLVYSNGTRRGGVFPLTLEAQTRDGQTVELEVPVRIPVPWWRSTVFLALLVAGFVLGTAGALLEIAHRRKVRLRETSRLLEASRERQREMVARLIHDEPLQELYTIRFRLQLAENGDATRGSDLAVATEAVDRAVGQLRDICRELRPTVLAGSDLAVAIREHAERMNAVHGEIEITSDVPESGIHSEDVRTAFFGVYLNALSNAVRHSRAQSIRISFRRTGSRFVLEVADDGQGFDASADWLTLAREGHFGFLDMSEWMRMIGGELKVDSSPASGTTIRASAPIAPRSDAIGVRAWLRRIQETVNGHDHGTAG